MGYLSMDDSSSGGTLEVDKVAPFLLKLYEIVSSPASDDLVCWSEHGETFKIVNRTKFAGDVLPLYFKHDNLRSFIRQLNIYGFQRCTNAPGRDNTMEFFHPSFTRNGAQYLKDIKRGNQASKRGHEIEDTGFHAEDVENGGHASQSGKRPRVGYSVFRSDVARLQQNLDDLENDLKQHSMQVQQKLAMILRALDDTPGPGSSCSSIPSVPSVGSENSSSSPGHTSSPSEPDGMAMAKLDEVAEPASNGIEAPQPQISQPPLGAANQSAALSGALPLPPGNQLGSSRDLAAVYLAAAGHTNPADVLGNPSSGLSLNRHSLLQPPAAMQLAERQRQQQMAAEEMAVHAMNFERGRLANGRPANLPPAITNGLASGLGVGGALANGMNGAAERSEALALAVSTGIGAGPSSSLAASAGFGTSAGFGGGSSGRWCDGWGGQSATSALPSASLNGQLQQASFNGSTSLNGLLRADLPRADFGRFPPSLLQGGGALAGLPGLQGMDAGAANGRLPGFGGGGGMQRAAGISPVEGSPPPLGIGAMMGLEAPRESSEAQPAMV